MKKILSLGNVLRYIVRGDMLFISTNNEVIRLDKNLEIIWKVQFPSILELEIFENILICNDLSRNSLVIDIKTGEAYNNFTNLPQTWVNKVFNQYIISLEIDGKSRFGIYNLRNNLLQWSIEKEVKQDSFIDKNRVYVSSRDAIGYDTGLIECFELETGNQVWQFSISEIDSLKYNNQYSKVSRIIGVLYEILIVQIKIETDLLIGLDAETSKLLWQLADFEYEGVQYPHLNSDIYRVRTNSENTRLIGINRRFVEINPLDGQVLKYKPIKPQDRDGKFSEYNGVGFIPFDGIVQGKYVYFNASVRNEKGRAAVLPSAVGIYNMETEQVEWLQVFKEFWQGEANAISGDIPPLISNNRLYVLDIKDTLHIFEKED